MGGRGAVIPWMPQDGAVARVAQINSIIKIAFYSTRVNRMNKLLTAQSEARVLGCQRRHAIIGLAVRITL